MATANQLDDGRKFFLLPSTLNFFQNIDGKCEHAIKTAKPIAIEWKDDFNAEADEGHIDYFAHSDDEEPPIDEDEPEDEEEEDKEDEDEEDEEDFDNAVNDAAENNNYFDFSKAMQAPDVTITFNNFRQLQNISLLPNKHLIVEGGGIFEGNFEVY